VSGSDWMKAAFLGSPPLWHGLKNLFSLKIFLPKRSLLEPRKERYISISQQGSILSS